MDPATNQLVRERAGNRCEYCRLPQAFSDLRFHVEHVIARQHGGSDLPNNLALACPECNYQKGTNLTGLDPDTGQVTPLFNPRHDHWAEHFSIEDGVVTGKTPMGRTTAWLLEMNRGDRLRLRGLLLWLGLFD
ncbi:MAG: HNH endonuclease [Verrucomicrobia bacterium]|nr:HNH endonuclease [Verrucomicrobiota bacterium]